MLSLHSLPFLNTTFILLIVYLCTCVQVCRYAPAYLTSGGQRITPPRGSREWTSGGQAWQQAPYSRSHLTSRSFPFSNTYPANLSLCSHISSTQAPPGF